MHRIEEVKAEMQRVVLRNKLLESQIIAHTKTNAEQEAEIKRLLLALFKIANFETLPDGGKYNSYEQGWHGVAEFAKETYAPSK